ncbi:hypothetical protein P3342_003975 [Pyrenophora teres f. teres]|nr:hypothetical protein P3342_003975 [Pyrenophora teres f. teres]
MARLSPNRNLTNDPRRRSLLQALASTVGGYSPLTQHFSSHSRNALLPSTTPSTPQPTERIYHSCILGVGFGIHGRLGFCVVTSLGTRLWFFAYIMFWFSTFGLDCFFN